jgi:hypothetical protein
MQGVSGGQRRPAAERFERAGLLCECPLGRSKATDKGHLPGSSAMAALQLEKAVCNPSDARRYHPAWPPSQAEIAAEGSAGRRPAQRRSREAHHSARPLHSPEGARRAMASQMARLRSTDRPAA